MEKQHLHLLINEEIYQVGGDEKLSISEETPNMEEVIEVTEEQTQVSEPKPEPLAKSKEEQNEKEEVKVKAIDKQDSPEIPTRKKEKKKETPFAIFHSSSNTEEMELLQKIIDACKIPSADYTIYANGFDQTIVFKKALVFVPEAKAFYSPIPYKESQFLCSKPLADLAKDQQEKGKLWVALQAFLK